MNQILVRNVKTKTYRQLRKQAAASGRSLQGQVNTILDKAAETPAMDRRRLAEMLERFRARFKGRTFSDSARMIREDRDR